MVHHAWCIVHHDLGMVHYTPFWVWNMYDRDIALVKVKSRAYIGSGQVYVCARVCGCVCCGRAGVW